MLIYSSLSARSGRIGAGVVSLVNKQGEGSTARLREFDSRLVKQGGKILYFSRVVTIRIRRPTAENFDDGLSQWLSKSMSYQGTLFCLLLLSLSVLPFNSLFYTGIEDSG